MNEQTIINNMVEDITQHSCKLDRKKVISLFIPENDKSAIYAVHEDNTKGYFSYVPYDFEGENIHGNTRNKIAKMFLDQITLTELYKLHADFIQAQENKVIQAENELPILESLLVEVNSIFANFSDKDFKIEICANHNRIKNFISIKYENHSINGRCVFTDFEIYIDSNNFIFRKDYQDNFIDKAELINQLQLVKESFIVEQNRFMAEQKAKHEATEKKRQLLFFTWYVTDKSNITILKMPRSFIAIGYEMYWVIGEGKEGKFINTNSDKIKKLIVNKHVTEYCTMSRAEYDFMFKSDSIILDLNKILKSLPYKLIADYKDESQAA
jgi:hypothetical protein